VSHDIQEVLHSPLLLEYLGVPVRRLLLVSVNVGNLTS
jgi:hypothetical protein